MMLQCVCMWCRCCRRCRRSCWRMEVVVGVMMVVTVLLYTVGTLRPASGPEANSGHEDGSGYHRSAVKAVHKAFSRHDPLAGVTAEPFIANGTSRMRHRQRVLTEYCRRHNDFTGSDEDDGLMSGPPPFLSTSLVSTQRNLLYCPVGKVASTFLVRFFVAAAETSPVVSPYVVPVEKAMRMRTMRGGKGALFRSLQNLVMSSGPKGEGEVLEGLRKVIFVRCPFRRLWSAYVDKLLFPNPYYWSTWGQHACELATSLLPPHQYPTREEAPCGGHNVTFSKFLRLVVTRLHRTDAHVIPVATQCAPCHVRHDVIGHVTTLGSDVTHLAALMELKGAAGVKGGRRGLGVDTWETERAQDAIRDGVRSVFHKWTSEIESVTTLPRASRRLWHVLQIRGILSEAENYPSVADRSPSPGDALEQALLEARARSVKDQEEKEGGRRRGKAGGVLQRQRDAAFVRAYNEVDAQLKEDIRTVYKHDFGMFGFDRLPRL